MKIRLLTDIEVTKTMTYLAGSARVATFQYGELRMRGYTRPLRDHEWELIINDAELQRQFPQVPENRKNKEE